MKLLVAVPSKGRAKTICKHAMRWLPRTGFQVRVFVEPQELKAYQEALEHGDYLNRTHTPDNTLVNIEQNDKGLGYAMGYIKRYAQDNGFDLVFKMDDDTKRFAWRGKNKPDEQMVVDFAEGVGTCRKTFGQFPDVAAIGFPYRNELHDPKVWTHLNARLQSCYIIKPEYIQDSFTTFEDFAQYIYIRSKNKATLRYGLMGIDAAKVGKNKGGCQDFDRKELAKQEAEKLRLIYPALEFKPVDKPWGIEPVLAGKFFGRKKI